jgi:hypothetical protein
MRRKREKLRIHEWSFNGAGFPVHTTITTTFLCSAGHVLGPESTTVYRNVLVCRECAKYQQRQHQRRIKAKS